MTQSTGTCAVCGALESLGTGMSRVLIEGRALCLCRLHAATVVAEMPSTFDEMRALFVGIPTGRASKTEQESGPTPMGTGTEKRAGEASRSDLPSAERRSPIARRDVANRRVFPPRLEGRRLSNGRRADDPVE